MCGVSSSALEVRVPRRRGGNRHDGLLAAEVVLQEPLSLSLHRCAVDEH